MQWEKLKTKILSASCHGHAQLDYVDLTIFGFGPQWSNKGKTDDLRFQGFKPSNTNITFLPPKTTSWVQPLDQGIIRAFKAIYRKYHI
jgi:hypothetical protein